MRLGNQLDPYLHRRRVPILGHMNPIWQFLHPLQVWAKSEDGQTMAEYGMLIAVIAVIVVLAATLLGGNISTLFSSTGGSL